LTIDSNGPILLSNVTASENGQSNAFGEGANISNQSAPSAQKVTLSGINGFNENYDSGLYVTSRGVISVNSVTASGNGENGVVLDNCAFLITDCTAATPQSVTLTGTNIINDNDSTGLSISSKGAIKVNSITANDNGDFSEEHGASLWNYYPSAVGGVTVSGTNQFNRNFDSGLVINTKGAISLNSLAASDNLFGDGVRLQNNASATSPQNVTLTGTNTFNGNYYTGIEIVSYGTVSLANVSSNNNGTSLSSGGGIYVYNAGGAVIKGVTLSGTSAFDNNYDFGLSIISGGPIKLNNITARDTLAGDGASLNNFGISGQSITLTGTNTFNGNSGNGLYLSSWGAVSLNNVIASNNGTGPGGGWGASINNSAAPSPQKVTLTGTNVFDANNDTGLQIISKGAVSLKNITATNTIDGLGVNVENACCVTTNAQPVALSGTNVLSKNSEEGLNVVSYGAISLNNVTANGNDSYGAHLSNSDSTAATPPKVALTGTNTFNENGNPGLWIQTKGPVTSALKLIANDNGDGVGVNYGAQIDNTQSTTQQSVTLLGSNTFLDNEATGLWVTSFGSITINNLTASGNDDMGALLDNCIDFSGCTVASPKDVKLTGTNSFIGNLSNGLTVLSNGSISLNNVTANDSISNKGVQLTNYTEGKGVTVSGTNSFTGNADAGLKIDSLGPITVNNLTAIDNNVAGAYFDNDAASGVWAVKLTGSQWFEDNTNGTMEIYSKGAISINSITAINNTGGILLQNCSWSGSACNPGTSAGVTLTGTNYIYGTMGGSVGLRIRSNGAVTLNKLTSNGNAGGGLVIDSSAYVTIACGSFTNNTGRGMDITSVGLITLKGVTSSGNSMSDVFNGSATPDSSIRSC
jgi:hypothetical protein